MYCSSFDIKDVYIDSIGIVVSKKEKEGPLGKYFANYIDDYLFNCDTFEKAQRGSKRIYWPAGKRRVLR